MLEWKTCWLCWKNTMVAEYEGKLEILRSFYQTSEATPEVHHALDALKDVLIHCPNRFTSEEARDIIQAEMERYRLLSIQSVSSPELEKRADECIASLRTLYPPLRHVFTLEDVRWLKALPGLIAERKRKIAEQKAWKRPNGKQRRHNECYRCGTPVDSSWHEICPLCKPSNPDMTGWMICPTCSACGCQYSGWRGA